MKKRNFPVPHFDFNIIHNQDHDTDGSHWEWDTLEIKAFCELSHNGSIMLEEPQDIWLLKEAVDRYIAGNPQLQNPTASQLSTPEYPLISDYLRGYQPTGEPGKGVIMRTSSDIQNDLADMDDLSVSDIAEAMTALGYRAHFSESGSHGWLLRPLTNK